MNEIPTVIVLDTETTGLREPQVLEVSWFELPITCEEGIYTLDLLALKHTRKWFSYFDVTKPIEPGAAKIHGITKQMLCGRDVFKNIEQLELPEPLYAIVGHNISYDDRALFGNLSQFNQICTLALYRSHYAGLDSYSLGKLIKKFFPEEAAALTEKLHTSSIDCKLTMLLLAKLMEDFGYTELESLITKPAQNTKSKEA